MSLLAATDWIEFAFIRDAARAVRLGTVEAALNARRGGICDARAHSGPRASTGARPTDTRRQDRFPRSRGRAPRHRRWQRPDRTGRSKHRLERRRPALLRRHHDCQFVARESANAIVTPGRAPRTERVARGPAAADSSPQPNAVAKGQRRTWPGYADTGPRRLRDRFARRPGSGAVVLQTSGSPSSGRNFRIARIRQPGPALSLGLGDRAGSSRSAAQTPLDCGSGGGHLPRLAPVAPATWLAPVAAATWLTLHGRRTTLRTVSQRGGAAALMKSV